MGGQPDYQGWLTSNITAGSCQALSFRDAQLVTTVQSLFIYLFFFIYVVIITLVILVHNYLASCPYEMKGAFHSTELCVLIYLKTQLRPKGFSVAVTFSGDYTVLFTSFSGYRNFFPIWSMPAGCEELVVGFEPVRSGEILCTIQ